MILRQGKWLVLDTAMPKWFVCVLCDGRCVYFREDTKPVLEHLFDYLQEGFSVTGIEAKDLKGIVFCQGPGSALGIRTVCLFLRTLGILPEGERIKFWAYNSMYWAQILLASKASLPFRLVTYAGFNEAHVLDVLTPGNFAPIKKMPRKEVEDKPATYWLPHMCKEGIEYVFNLEAFLNTPKGFFNSVINPDLFRTP